MNDDDRISRLELEVERIKSEHSNLLLRLPLDAGTRVSELEETLELRTAAIDSRIVDLSHRGGGIAIEELGDVMLDAVKILFDGQKLLYEQIRKLNGVS